MSQANDREVATLPEEIVDERTPGASSTPSEHDAEKQQDLQRLDSLKATSSIAETLPPFREFMFVSVVCLAQLMTQAALGQTLSILHVIGDSFGLTNPGDLAWLIAGYSLTVGTFILIAGRLGDLYGYKRMLLIGFAWFSLWSMVAGLAVYSNKVLFIFARVLTGIGPSLCLPNGLAILGITYNPGPKKNLVFALFGAVAPGGSILGAAAAGLFAQLTWWPWSFYSMAITLAIIVVVGVYAVPNDPRPRRESRRSWKEYREDADVYGGIVGVTALILINFAWNQAAVVGWSHAYVYVLLIIGILMVPLFFYIEFRVSKSPLVPFDVINGKVGFVLGCIGCGWGCFGIWIYYTWQFFEELRDATPLQGSAWLAPVAITGALASLTTAWLLGRVQPAWVMVISMTAFAVGTILVATAPVTQIYWSQTFIMSLIITFGMDMSFPSAAIILSDAVPKRHQGIGMSLVNTVVNYSISIALGIAGTIEKNITNGDMSRPALLKGYRSAWYFAIGLAMLGMTLSGLFLLTETLKRRRR